MPFDESQFPQGNDVESNKTATFEMQWQSDINIVDQAEGEFQYRLQQFGFREEEAQELALGFREILTNAIIHGNESNPSKIVDTTLTISPGELIVSIRDEGVGFEQKDVSDPLSDEGLMKKSGRGLLLTKAAFEVQNHMIEGGGHEVLLIKRRDK